MTVTSVLMGFLQNLSLAAQKGLAKAAVNWQGRFEAFRLPGQVQAPLSQRGRRERFQACGLEGPRARAAWLGWRAAIKHERLGAGCGNRNQASAWGCSASGAGPAARLAQLIAPGDSWF